MMPDGNNEGDKRSSPNSEIPIAKAGASHDMSTPQQLRWRKVLLVGARQGAEAVGIQVIDRDLARLAVRPDLEGDRRQPSRRFDGGGVEEGVAVEVPERTPAD